MSKIYEPRVYKIIALNFDSHDRLYYVADPSDYSLNLHGVATFRKGEYRSLFCVGDYCIGITPKMNETTHFFKAFDDNGRILVGDSLAKRVFDFVRKEIESYNVNLSNKVVCKVKSIGHYKEIFFIQVDPTARGILNYIIPTKKQPTLVAGDFVVIDNKVPTKLIKLPADIFKAKHDEKCWIINHGEIDFTMATIEQIKAYDESLKRFKQATERTMVDDDDYRRYYNEGYLEGYSEEYLGID